MNDIESKGRVLKLVFMINVDLRTGGGNGADFIKLY
jgi:hypothetical protein